MCKTFEAIHKIAKKLKKEGKGGESIELAIFGAKVKGTLYCCVDGHDCYEGVLTLKDVKVECFNMMGKEPEVKEKEWLNIPTHNIIAFHFV
ncbi:hypothetical protein tpqmel_0296 [Candidatus Gastranaerophilus sp. (ex Termes propinquus)]|nr:hypothetical protein tpqmel_0296 [Candidatus Gastranaerophilus sp. (ex Termes propinquus)]